MLSITEHSYGLVGKCLSHSYSKVYFDEKIAKLGMDRHHYDLLEMPTPDKIRDVSVKNNLSGFNVTIPYKESIIPYLDSIDYSANEIGAVNTVKVLRDADGSLRLHGYNTDAPAFLDTLHPLLKPWHTDALILGTGGAAKAVAWALRQLGIGYLFVSRTPEQRPDSIGYSELKDSTQLLIVNATPVGMFPNVDASPWPYPDMLTQRHLCYDLIYNPSPTLFLRQAKQHEATIQDGLAMLHRQADLAFEIWEGENKTESN